MRSSVLVSISILGAACFAQREADLAASSKMNKKKYEKEKGMPAPVGLFSPWIIQTTASKAQLGPQNTVQAVCGSVDQIE